MGEKMEDLEPFYPDRRASRILGMGDVLTLIDKVQQNIDEQEAKEMQKKMLSNEFTLEDFLSQMQQIKKMGPLKDLMGMIPGMNKFNLDEALNGVDPSKEMAKTEAIIQSMTREERLNPSILNGPRKKRIANGSGRSIEMCIRDSHKGDLLPDFVAAASCRRKIWQGRYLFHHQRFAGGSGFARCGK